MRKCLLCGLGDFDLNSSHSQKTNGDPFEYYRWHPIFHDKNKLILFLIKRRLLGRKIDVIFLEIWEKNIRELEL